METAELSLQLRDLMKVVRLLKQQRESLRPGMPTGMVGILMIIDQLSGGNEGGPTEAGQNRVGQNRAGQKEAGTDGGCHGCHAKELARRAGLDQSTVSRSVAALVNHGLVDRVPDPADKRASILAVTPVGRQALAEARDWFEGVLTRALEEWREEEIDVLSASLGRFVTDLDGALRTEKSGTDKLRNDKILLENAR
jgi:DNA-binding MarR family transcriptional regulator